MMSFMASLRKEILEQWRTNRLLITVVVLGVFGMLSPLMAKFTPEILKAVPGADAFAGLVPTPTVMDAFTQYIKNIEQFGILIALLITMGAVAQEKDKGTAALMLVKPLSRGGFLLSKFLAIGLTLLVSLAIAGLGAYYYTLFLFNPTDLGAWAAMNGLILVQFMVIVAITLLFSTLVRSQAAAAGLAVGVLLLSSIVGIVPSISKYLPGELTNWGGNIMVGGPLTAWPALWISLGIIVACLVTAWLIFERQEL
jgi:ABC-2 type transport system permease protein